MLQVLIMKSASSLKTSFGVYAIFLIIIGILALSWHMSGQDGYESKAISIKLAAYIAKTSGLFHGYVSWIELLNKLIRKMAHFTEYAVLAALLGIVLKRLIRKAGWAALYTILAAFLWACLDEYHQSLTAGRYARWLDVMIDTAGAALGILIVIVHDYINKLQVEVSALKKENALLKSRERILTNLMLPPSAQPKSSDDRE